MIHLDTNAVIAVLNNKSPAVRTRIGAAIVAGRPLAMSSIVLFELRYGAAKSARPDRNVQRIADFLVGRSRSCPSSPKTPMRRAISAPRWSAWERRSAPTMCSSPPRRGGAMRFS